jgi:hypothetical protein
MTPNWPMINPPTPDDWQLLQLLAPTPEAVATARRLAGHTHAAAGQALHVDGRTWRRWEAGDRAMHPAMWELYRIKALGFVPMHKTT